MTSENFVTIDLTNSSNSIIEIEDTIIISPIQKKNIGRTSKSLNLEQNEIIYLSSPSCKRVLESPKDRPGGIGMCPICWEDLGANSLASAKCGHVYCLKCIESYVRKERKCPTCRCQLKGSSAYHPLYLNLQ